MNITEFAIQNKAVTYFVIFLLVVGGTVSFFNLGQLEDPDFTVKTALVITAYPGASPKEVELEVTDRLEKAIQEMPQLDQLKSISKAGFSIITVDIKQQYWADSLPQIWDELRHKVNDVSTELPPGTSKPIVADDFSFVYGFVLALTGDGYSHNELENYAEEIRKQLSLVDGVARVELWGVQKKVIYLDISEQQLTSLNITPQNIFSTLQKQNMVVDAGSVDVQNRRFRVAPSGSFTHPKQIGDLFITAHTRMQTAQQQAGSPTGIQGQKQRDELFQIKDVATVSMGYLSPPINMMRYDGQPAIAISIANQAGGNVVDTGEHIDKRIQELQAYLPVGIKLHKLTWQSDLVKESVNSFIINLIEAIAIVLFVLAFSMGWRMGIIIGTGLLLTILAVFVVMSVSHIDLQRMSLGALIIALGMMVDNSIVVADGIVVRMKQGMDRTKAAIEAASKPSIPLLGATIIATMAFYPIFASNADAGEYCRTLFIVVGVSLLLSWLIAVTVTPLQCLDMLPKEKANQGKDENIYGSHFYMKYRSLLELAIQKRYPFMLVMLGLLVFAIVGFGYVKQMFFPDATRAQLMIDFWYPEGTRIQDVAKGIKPAEKLLMNDKHVQNVSSFVGQGPPRFYLPVDPELPYQNYAEIIVNTNSYDDVDPLIKKLEPWLNQHYPDAITRVRKYGVGPGDTWKFEWHIIGPANANLDTLHKLGAVGKEILLNNENAKEVKTVMMNKVQKIIPNYDQARGRWSGITRDDVAMATRRSQDGIQIGLYREGDDLYPIVARSTVHERERAAELEILQIKPLDSIYSVPLAQVTRGINLEWESPIIFRFDRRRSNTIQATPHNTTYPDLKTQVLETFHKLKLPKGYQIYMDGESSSTRTAQDSLIPGMIPAAAIILFILVALFNAYRPPLIIILTIPFALIGITAGLLLTGAYFGFLALLGAMSLSGMMIKNAVVLLDQVKLELEAGKSPYEAVVSSGVSRLRPVALGAATTILGVLPLYPDVFWNAMVVTIMAGLAFGTILTMFVVPVLYCMFYKIYKASK